MMKDVKQYLQNISNFLWPLFTQFRQKFAAYSQTKWLILGIVGILFVLMLGFGLMASSDNKADEVTIRVERGMTGDQIGQMLYDKGLFPSLTVFHGYARFYGLEKSLQAGEYTFSKKMSISRMITMLSQGQTTSRQFTIPEGYTVEQIAQLIEKSHIGNAKAFKELAQKYAPYEYMAGNADTVYRAEGFLFPSTYQVSQQVTEKQLLDMMNEQFQQQFTPQMRERAAAEGLSVREAIILASLVEKEAQKAVDRPVIAGVFLNRLKQLMPLQSCATIQYILGYPKAELSVQDTELPSAYNTYLHQGLPPGPIANPGMAAINAVLYPTATDYLYFVADKQGAHHFSKTYEEHLIKIQQVAQ